MAARNLNVKITADVAHIRRSVRRVLMAQGFPVHRADVPVDSCSLVLQGYPHGPDMTDCLVNVSGKHRAATVDSLADLGWVSEQ